jgi:hypothetical protein
VVGTGEPVECPSRGSRHPRRFRRDVAVPGTTLSGFRRLSERSDRCSGVMGSPLPPRRLDGHEVFHQPASRRTRRSAAAPTGLPALSGFWPRGRPRPEGRDAPPGVPAPPATSVREVRFSRVCLTRHVPPSGFLTLSTVSALSSLRSGEDRCRSWGLVIHGALSSGRPGMRRRIPARSRSRSALLLEL